MADKPSSDSPEKASGSDKDPPLVTSAEPGAPIDPDAIDPELVNLKVPSQRRHPLVAVAVLLVSLLLLYKLRADVSYALLPDQPVSLGVADGAIGGKLAGQGDKFVRVFGLPDHRNSVAYDPKGGRGRVQVFRVAGTATKLLVARKVSLSADVANEFTGRLRPISEVWFADALRSYFEQTQALRALDLDRLKAAPTGKLTLPLGVLDRSGQPLSVSKEQELLIDVLFEDDVRVLLSKEKFPSEPDARYEVERLGLPHGPGIETRDGFGYVLRLPPKGPARQKLLAQIDSLGIWLWHRIETYRVPSALISVLADGLEIPGPESLQQPVRYRAPATASNPATVSPAGASPAATGSVSPAAPAAAPDAGTPAAMAATAPAATVDGKLLQAIREPTTLLSWSDVQAVQVSEPLRVPSDAFVLFDGEAPKQLQWAPPVAVLLALFVLLNIYYLIRLRPRAGESS